MVNRNEQDSCGMIFFKKNLCTKNEQFLINSSYSNVLVHGFNLNKILILAFGYSNMNSEMSFRFYIIYGYVMKDTVGRTKNL